MTVAMGMRMGTGTPQCGLRYVALFSAHAERTRGAPAPTVPVVQGSNVANVDPSSQGVHDAPLLSGSYDRPIFPCSLHHPSDSLTISHESRGFGVALRLICWLTPLFRLHSPAYAALQQMLPIGQPPRKQGQSSSFHQRQLVGAVSWASHKTPHFPALPFRGTPF
jgi:hypothetical protein